MQKNFKSRALLAFLCFSFHFFYFFAPYCFSLLLFVLFALSTNFKHLFAFVVLWRHLLLVRQTSEISLLSAALSRFLSLSFSLRRWFVCFFVFSCFCALLLLVFSQLILSSATNENTEVISTRQTDNKQSPPLICTSSTWLL